MNNDIRLFKIQNISKRNITPYGEIFLIEASEQNKNRPLFDEYFITDEFRLSIDSSLIKEIRQAYQDDQLWQVDMSNFQIKDDTPDVNGEVGIRTIYEELVVIDEKVLKAMFDKAIRKKVLAQMGFAGLDELITYTAKVTTIKDGAMYASHDFVCLLAKDEDDAYNEMLSAVSRREGRIVRPSDILSCVIHTNGETLFDSN